jgi:hypothetical protein
VAEADPAAKSDSLSDPAVTESKRARSTRLDLGAFRRLRDHVLAGRRYTALYSAHSPEVVRLMLTDSALRSCCGSRMWRLSRTGGARPSRSLRSKRALWTRS